MYDPPKRRSFSKAVRSEVYAKTNGRCAYCGCEITMRAMQVDHVFPVSMGGTDDARNLLPACRSCNYYKGAETLSIFRRAIERWPDVLRRDSVTYRNAVRFGMVEPKPHSVVFYFERIGIVVDEFGEIAANGGTE